MDEWSWRGGSFWSCFWRALLAALVLPRLHQGDQVAVEGVQGRVHRQEVKDRIASLLGFQQYLHLGALASKEESSFLYCSKQLHCRRSLGERGKHQLSAASVHFLFLGLRLPRAQNSEKGTSRQILLVLWAKGVPLHLSTGLQGSVVETNLSRVLASLFNLLFSRVKFTVVLT